jgi:hypothetical protein
VIYTKGKDMKLFKISFSIFSTVIYFLFIQSSYAGNGGIVSWGEFYTDLNNDHITFFQRPGYPQIDPAIQQQVSRSIYAAKSLDAGSKFISSRTEFVKNTRGAIDSLFSQDELNVYDTAIKQCEVSINEAENSYAETFKYLKKGDENNNSPFANEARNARSKIAEAKSQLDYLKNHRPAYEQARMARFDKKAEEFGKKVGSFYTAKKPLVRERRRIKEANITYAKNAQTDINLLNQLTRAELDIPSSHITFQIEKEAGDYIREQIAQIDTFAQNSIFLAQDGANSNTVKLVSDFANDIAVAAHQFVNGTGHGVYGVFRTATDAAFAIYNDPTLLANLSTNIMNTITDPTTFIQSAKDSYTQVMTVVYSGSAYDRGYLLGEFAGNVVVGIAATEVTTAGKAALEGIGNKILEAKPAHLGEALLNKVDTSVPLAAEVSAAQVNAQKIVDSATRLGVREGSQVKHFGDLTKQTGKGAEELANDLRGAQGKIGKEFETHLERGLGGQGSFSAGLPIPKPKMREFDGTVGNIWYEAKSGNYWNNNYGGKGFGKFQSDIGEHMSIAQKNGKEFHLFSNTPIADEAKEWLNKKGIKFIEMLE